MKYSGEDNLDALVLAENYNHEIIEKISSQLKDTDSFIVDFGAGSRTLANLLEKKINKEICCIEPAENLKKFYKNKICYDSLNELPDKSVDVIYSSNVLEHIKKDDEIVELFYQKLKQGGRVILYLPAFDCLYSAMDKKVGHFRRYSKNKIENLFQNNEKWTLKELYYADSCGFFITLLYKLIGSKDGKLNPDTLKIYDKYIFPISNFLDKLGLKNILGKNIFCVIDKK